MRKPVLSLVTAAVLAASVVVAIATPVALAARAPAPPPASGLIYALDATGSGLGNVAVRADGAGYTQTPAGNPSYGPPRAYVAAVDGALILTDEFGATTELARDPALRPVSVAWSPDDSRIAFLAYDATHDLIADSGYTLYTAPVIRASTTSLGEVKKVADLPHVATFAWAPSSDRLVVTRPNPAHKKVATDPDAFAPPDVFVVTLDGVMSNLTNTPAPEHYPAWSPDGTRIAFVRQTVVKGNVRADVFTLRMSDPTTAAQVTSKTNTAASSNNYPLAWSPDGKHIAFSGVPFSGGLPHLYRIDAAGTTTAVDLMSRTAGYFVVRAWR